MAGYIALQIEQYATFSRSIILRLPDGTAQNLTGYTANTMMRKSHYSSSSVVINTDINDAANGEITLSLSAQETGNLTPGRYVFDIITTAVGVTQRLLEGIVVVNPGVTY